MACRQETRHFLTASPRGPLGQAGLAGRSQASVCWGAGIIVSPRAFLRRDDTGSLLGSWGRGQGKDVREQSSDPRDLEFLLTLTSPPQDHEPVLSSS